MTSKPYIVLGEAPESDNEEEIDSSLKCRKNLKQYKGKVVGGEAPESDEESNADTGSVDSISSALSASSVPSLTGDRGTNSKKSSSLLVKKLRERNASLQKSTRDFVTQTITSAGNELNLTNQQLVKCQVQLQEAADLMKGIKSSLVYLDNNIQILLSTPFLPDIKIESKSERATGIVTYY